MQLKISKISKADKAKFSSYIADGSVKWYNLFEKLLVNFLKS